MRGIPGCPAPGYREADKYQIDVEPGITVTGPALPAGHPAA
jgi:hypothetical protein